MGTTPSKPELPQAEIHTKVSTKESSNNNAMANRNDNESNTDTNPDAAPAAAGGGSGGGCPMKQADGSYLYDWKAMFQKHPHGPKGSKPLDAKAAAAAASEGGAVVQQYNVYSQPIDPTNQMPAVANQLPAPGQTEELSTSRVPSSISKGGAEQNATWTYPSPQMFYNALARKGKLGDTKEADMESLVAVHNNMNEKTWARVVEWERVLSPDSDPRLLKFMGRPADLSPKAAVKHYLFGHPLPYDRHDWTVLRTDGTTVRYVIDYYHDESRGNESPESAVPDIKNPDATPSLLVDVRPAVDTPVLAWNRLVTMPVAQHVTQSTKFQPLPLIPTAEMKSQLQDSLHVWAQIKANAQRNNDMEALKQSISEDDARAIARSFAQVLKECREASAKIAASQSAEEEQRASLDLTICMAKIMCPLQHTTLTKALTGDDENTIEAALDRVTACVVANTAKRSAAKEKFPSVFD